MATAAVLSGPAGAVRPYEDSSTVADSEHHYPHASDRAAPGGGLPPSSPNVRWRTPQEIGTELEDLYRHVRGGLYANVLIDAKASFAARDFAKTAELLQAGRELYRQAHRKLLRQDPRSPDADKKEASRLLSKQAEIEGVLKRFDELLQQLEKMARLQTPKPQAPAVQSDSRHEPQYDAGFPRNFRAAFVAVRDAAAQLQVIREYFRLTAVNAERDLLPGAFYALQGKGQCHLICCEPNEPGSDTFPMTLALTGKRMKPVSRQTLLELGRKQQLHRLAPKSEADVVAPSHSRPRQQAAPSGKDEPAGPKTDSTLCLIDSGSFTQLVNSAQQSGLVPNADAIAYVRDQEFRTGKYQKAFDILESLVMRFKAAADQRAVRLRREEIDYKSGTLKLSPKRWQLKQQRDTAQTQNIERARRHFARVLDGLRVLMVSAHDPKSPSQKQDTGVPDP